MKVWSWRQAILKSEISSTTKLVLLALSTYMNDHGEGCYPSQDQIAKDTSLSKRAVINHLEIAVREGFLVKDKRNLKGKLWDSNEYKATIPSDNEPRSLQNEGVNENHPTAETCVFSGEPDSPLEGLRGAPRALEGCTTFTQGVNHVHTNSSKNSPEEQQEASARKITAAAAAEIVNSFSEVFLKVWGVARKPRVDDIEQAEKLAAMGLPLDFCREVFLRKMLQMQIAGNMPPGGVCYFKSIIPEEFKINKSLVKNKQTALPDNPHKAKLAKWLALPGNVDRYFQKSRELSHDVSKADEFFKSEWETIPA